VSKATLYRIALIWLAGLAFSLWKWSMATEVVISISSMSFGIIVLITDPRTEESKRIGWKTIGIALLISGIFTMGIVIVEKLVLYR
jgi:hypothetical protein